MFSDNNFDVYSFNSNWKKKFTTKECITQTDTYKIVQRGLNIKRYRNDECQTDSYLYVEEDIHADADESELNDFVKRVTPKIYEVLLNNERSCAFDVCQLNTLKSAENACIYIFENNLSSTSVTNISQLSWNCNGTVLAAAYGDILHDKWCVHGNTGVGLFSLNSRNKSNLKGKADSFLETTSCACCVQFHQQVASLIAAGTYNGDLIVWDRSKSDNDLIFATNSENKVHQEAINTILWLNASTVKNFSSNFRIISMGIDGTIVLWNLSMRKSTLIPLNWYTLTARDLPKSIRYKGSLSKCVSILCGALNPKDSDYLVVGIDIGVLFLCQIKSKANPSIASEMKEIDSPVESVLGTVSGAIHGVRWSEVVLNFLAAVASSGIIEIFNVDEKQKVFSIDPDQGYLYGLSLSSLMLGLIATAGENGTIVLTNVLDHYSKINDVTSTLETNSDISSVNSGLNTILKGEGKNTTQDPQEAFACVEFNNISINYIAASDMNGTIFVWNLSQQLTELNSKFRLSNFENLFGSFRIKK